MLIDGRIVQPEEKDVLDRFNRDYRGWLERHGPEIGEKAMQGDAVAHQVIIRYQAFTGWLTEWSLRALDASIRDWQRKGIYILNSRKGKGEVK